MKLIPAIEAEPSLKIALVEDHVDLRDMMIDYLCAQNHDAAGFNCAEELDDHLADNSVDLLILDLNLPGENGYSIARRLREAHPDLYIIMLTARTDVSDRVKGYASGADIYLCKPVSPAELTATVGGVARRVQWSQLKRVTLVLDPVKMTLTGEKAEVRLAAAEVMVLKCLAESPGHKLEYWRLLELLDIDLDDKGKAVLEVHISRLRKKMQAAGVSEPSIKSRWKEGYSLCAPLAVVG